MYRTAADEFEEPSDVERHADVALLGRLFSLANGDLRESIEAAEAIIYRFGNAGAVLNASPFLLKKWGLLPAHVDAIRLVWDAAEACLIRRLERRPLINSKERALNYLHFRLAYEDRERVAVIFLTKRLRFLHYEEISIGSIASSPCSVRTIAARALEVNAGAIIVAHNHPSGNPEPTPDDRTMTMILHRLCSDLEIKLVDNIVISTAGSRSLIADENNRRVIQQLGEGTQRLASTDQDPDRHFEIK